jgi:hypothetical protein
MAQTITNLALRNAGFVASPPVARLTAADLTATSGVLDLGVADLKNIRLRLRLKTFSGSTPVASISLHVDNAVAMDSVEVVHTTGNFGVTSGADAYLFDIEAWSNTGFRYAKIVLNTVSGTGHTYAYDYVIEAV